MREKLYVTLDPRLKRVAKALAIKEGHGSISRLFDSLIERSDELLNRGTSKLDDATARLEKVAQELKKIEQKARTNK
jgi:hypothetical protein